MNIREKRLRLAVCGVYSLTLGSMAAGVVRITLLSQGHKDNIEKIYELSIIETSVFIMVAALPGISSSFIRKCSGDSLSLSRRPKTDQIPAHSSITVQNEVEVRVDNVPLKPIERVSGENDFDKGFYSSTENIVPVSSHEERGYKEGK